MLNNLSDNEVRHLLKWNQSQIQKLQDVVVGHPSNRATLEVARSMVKTSWMCLASWGILTSLEASRDPEIWIDSSTKKLWCSDGAPDTKHVQDRFT